MAGPQRTDRRHANEDDDRQRTRFQRDRDAVLYTTAFRRLGGVTQVVSPGEGQVYHNRLTHSIEVAQIAQRLAERLCDEFPDAAAKHELDPSVAETAALAHDLGHPPFGHVAEKELNRLMRDAGAVDGYEGNAQSFRIVTKLSVRNKNDGLNLTRASLNAILKYPRIQEASPGGEQRHQKWGAYASERPDFEFAREMHPDGDTQRSVEAQLMDWADDIAYSVHDTEDFYRAGLIPLGLLALADYPVARENFVAAVFERWDAKQFEYPFDPDDLAAQFYKVCDLMPFDRPYEPSRDQRAQLRAFTSDFIGRYVTSTKLRDEPDEHGSLLDIPDEHVMQVTMLKELTWQFVIKGKSLAGMQHGQRKVIETLFVILSDVAASNDPHGQWHVLPARNRAAMEALKEKHGATKVPDVECARVAADAVSGMTDQQAVLMYQRLTGISCGSVLDAIVI
jgi:dGTPase